MRTSIEAVHSAKRCSHTLATEKFFKPLFFDFTEAVHCGIWSSQTPSFFVTLISVLQTVFMCSACWEMKSLCTGYWHMKLLYSFLSPFLFPPSICPSTVSFFSTFTAQKHHNLCVSLTHPQNFISPSEVGFYPFLNMYLPPFIPLSSLLLFFYICIFVFPFSLNP